MPFAAVLDLLLLAAALVPPLVLRPWRMTGSSGPPWPWLGLPALMPLLWTIDHQAGLPQALPLSAAPLLVLLAGWPLAVLLMLPAGMAVALLTDMAAADALHRLAWLGLVPATLALALGAAVRRWLPHHLFVYILGRGFFGTATASLAAAVLASAQAGAGGDGDALLARVLAAFAEAFLTGLVTAILVAYRPQWLATYADSLYLPAAPRP